MDVGLLVLEVGDSEQARRVVELARRVWGVGWGEREVGSETGMVVVEVWFDDGRVETEGRAGRGDEDGGLDRAREEVSARAVVVWRREWAEWRKRGELHRRD